jgi:hypothetical protein
MTEKGFLSCSATPWKSFICAFTAMC